MSVSNLTSSQEMPIRILSQARDPEREKLLIDELGVPSLLAAILVGRGLTDPVEAHKFLNPSLDELGDPRLLPDFAAAEAAILGAKERGETIFIHGDYDVDGVTSATLLTRFLKRLGASVVTHVPHRMKEGYGIHPNAVDAAIAAGAKLFLTCDCGVGAHEQVERARAAGMAVVVTDHHLVPDQLPRAQAVVNPHRTDNVYPFVELSGAGVVFRLCEGIAQTLGINVSNYRRAFLDIAAIGTVADVMPLVGENRIITRHGVDLIAQTNKIGLQALLRQSGLTEKSRLTARDIGFVIGPRLNAAGRMDDAALSLDLLLEEDPLEAAQTAEKIEEINRHRKEEQHQIEDEAVNNVLESGAHERFVIVVGKEGWHPGLVGLVAGRLTERFRRPSVVMTIDSAKGTVKASARSIPGFHLGHSLSALSHLLSGGGHAMAAGFSAKATDVEAIIEAFDVYGRTVLTAEDFIPTYEVDAQVDPDEVTIQSVESLRLLEPFGNSNPEPTFHSVGLNFADIRPTSNPNIAQLKLVTSSGRTVKGVSFREGQRLSEMSPGFMGEVVYKAVVEQYQGSTYLKFDVRTFQVMD